MYTLYAKVKNDLFHSKKYSPISLGYRIQRLYMHKGKTLKSILDITLKQFCSFGECGVIIYCHYSQIYFVTEW